MRRKLFSVLFFAQLSSPLVGLFCLGFLLLLPAAGLAEEDRSRADRPQDGESPSAARLTERPPPPVPLGVLSPIHLLYYHLPPTAAAPLGPGVHAFGVQVSESNALHEPEEDLLTTFTSDVDLELTRLAFTWEHGVTERWDVAVEVPFYTLHQGFLDTSIHEVESFFGQIKPRRRNEFEDAAQNQFTYRLLAGEQVIVDGESGHLDVGDVAVSVKRAWGEARGRRPALALRAGLKLPTGQRSRFYGSGEMDLAVGAVADWHVSPWTLRAGTQLTLPLGDLADAPGLDPLPQLAVYGEIAYSPWRRLALHAQLAGTTGALEVDHRQISARSPLRFGTGDDTFEGHIVQVTPAVSWRLTDGGTVFFGLVEDFANSEDTAFDVTAFTALRWRFGG